MDLSGGWGMVASVGVCRKGGPAAPTSALMSVMHKALQSQGHGGAQMIHTFSGSSIDSIMPWMTSTVSSHYSGAQHTA